MTSNSESPFFAAVDLGSNSFHMVVAKYADGRVQIVDRMKEMVRLADGLDEQRNLDDATVERTIACLERFGQRISEMPSRHVRAVGTNTLRQARNSAAFLSRARHALGHRIEIIAGREEARLIYLGVAHTVFKEGEQRLVVDIGGGSTEVIIGRDFQPQLTESLYMGCVSMTHQFFADGKINAKRMRKAILFARQELEAIETPYRRTGWESAIGASGTILSINKVLNAQGWTQGGITPAGLEQLREVLVRAGEIDNIKLDGLSSNRKPVFAGGVAVLSALFEALGIGEMAVSDGALREGLLHELIGRDQQRDVREQTVADLQQRYSVDIEHATRIEQTARYCLEKINESSSDSADHHEQSLLSWAARLHEIGQAIAHSGYQKHGAYLVHNSDLPGFSRQEQHYVATLIRNHRRKISSSDFDNLPDNGTDRILLLCILLRLAIVLNRSRTSAELPSFQLTVNDRNIEIVFPDGWLEAHPLTGADLETEAGYLQAAGYALTFR
ncbi:exopolyphosphatase/guanosine-5'-triphosphate,3'-diphosphate pyrophosphatase [Methylohalomonas lacus]|uniref:Exopolyphosphatase n=1 Tax=Methylohalomonas lacus TaxID=398773 RepID=A0AAE3HKE4_9GAMM|nr:exopolyphosphatase [Methylohalomonas lacus]MCS3903975.1 exopolyphosphatase/guanosine-5'-triphosphate,3'-diphosphate pyrophosphatase [Methylohalomonas lacus]